MMNLKGSNQTSMLDAWVGKVWKVFLLKHISEISSDVTFVQHLCIQTLNGGCSLTPTGVLTN